MTVTTLIMLIGTAGAVLVAGVTLWRAWQAVNVPRLNFSDDALAIIAEAQATAQARGNAAITPEHLLLALVGGTSASATTAAATALGRVGVDVEAVRARLDVSLPAGTPGLEQLTPPYTSRAKHSLVQAVHEALAQRREDVGPLQLLAGILREGRSVAARTLGDAGATLPVVRRAASFPS